MRHDLALLLLAVLLSAATARAEHIVGAAAAPSGARCRLFVLATSADTRFVLAERGAEQDAAVTLLDTFAPAAPALGATALEDAYGALRPAFLHAQELLLARPRPLQLEPRHCHAHVLATGAAHQAAHLDALFARVHQESIEDAQFPFLLAKDDLRRVDADTQSYFFAVGANLLDGRVPPSLSPGSEELRGVFALDADAARMTFDVLERWRRTKRQKHLPLNTTDFFVREYAGHSRAAVRDAVATQLRAQQAREDDEDALKHPCFLTGYEDGELQGAGDAQACVREIQAYVDAGNAACPEDNFCALNGGAQPRPTGSFYGAGLFRSAAAFAHAVLQSQQAKHAAVEPLAMPTPTLAALRAAADVVCALPFAQAREVQKVYARQSEHACLDLCHVLVLLRAFGVRDDDARVSFASPFPAAAASAAQQLSADEATWLTGAFQYLERIQQRKAFVMEAELLAVQVDEGLPIGFHLSLALFAAAVGFLFATTGSRSPPPLAGSRRRPSVVATTKPQRATHAILFVDDSSE